MHKIIEEIMYKIIEEISAYYNISRYLIFKKARNQDIIFYRHLFFYVTKTIYPDIPYKTIGNFGGQYGCSNDHATVINGCKKIRDRIDSKNIKKEEILIILNICKERNKNIQKLLIEDIDLLSLCYKPKYQNNYESSSYNK